MGYYKVVFMFIGCALGRRLVLKCDKGGWVDGGYGLLKYSLVVITTLDNWNNTKCNNNAIYN